ncbi:TetR/AcrR family transcriptional regulator [Actinomadura sp. ATCC 31491]|uniref:TetR/AcrR family transcriptional regulator n=1 Tax=Actinomadura luzonensis TaxID=2805427 RepID=A0ABT0FV55_9ACTN|nr:TetR/AcrR family transcriptional regulator [Actinomadura luzonensis]MCK2215791.1 TetR/AcrR family transcriptional regulator [Actinomadura luzonensis]
MPRISVKSRLVDSAEDVFRRQGFGGASVQDITTAAGVPKGSFYNHFPSKQALAVEIVRRYARGTDFSALAAGDGSSCAERLRRHFLAQAERTRATGVEFGCLLATFAGECASAGEPVRAAVREILDSWTAAVAATVAEGQESGELTASRPAGELAAFLIDSFEGATLRAKATGDQSAVPVQLDLALAALRAAPATAGRPAP